MNFNQLLKTAFRLGCGKPNHVGAMFRSAEFQALLLKHQQNLRDGKNSFAYRHGPQEVYYRSMLSVEDIAYETPEEARLQYQADPYFQATVEYLGSALINSAERLLPQEAQTLAEEWKASSGERQLAVAGKIFSLLRHFREDERAKRESPHPLGHYFSDFAYQGISRILPENVVQNKELLPNCLLLSQMLLAFSKLCGARAYLISPIDSHSQYGRTLQALFQVSSLSTAICQRFVTEEASLEQCRSLQMDTSLKLLWLSNFHYGIVMELDDNRWVLIDPYSGTWGVVPHFEPYHLALELIVQQNPGFCLQIDLSFQNQPIGVNLVKDFLPRIPDYIAPSLEFRNALCDAIELAEERGINYETVMTLLPRSELYRLFLREEGLTSQIIQSFESEEMFALSLLSGFAGEDELLEICSDADALKERIDALLAYPLEVAARDFGKAFDAKSQNGGILHPSFEVSAPEFSIGLRVLRELTVAQGGDLSVLRQIAAESNSQMSFYDQAHFLRDDSADSKRRIEIASQSPFVHPAVRAALEQKFFPSPPPNPEEEPSEWLKDVLSLNPSVSFESSSEEEPPLPTPCGKSQNSLTSTFVST